MKFDLESLDLSAAVIPGRQAAGFFLGANLPDDGSLSGVKRWDPSCGEQLGYALSSNTGWMIYSYHTKLEGPIRIDSIFYGVGGCVNLKFEDEVLCYIVLGEGYLGGLPGGVVIGSSKGEVAAALGTLEYDEFEELHYPVEYSEEGVALEFDSEDVLVSITIGVNLKFWKIGG